jgi:hypothetical protein
MPFLYNLLTSYKVTILHLAKYAKVLQRYTKALTRIWSVACAAHANVGKRIPRIITLRWYFAGFLITACHPLVPLALAKGASGGHMSAVGSNAHAQCDERSRYSYPFWGPSHYEASFYNLNYVYMPTPEQKARAKQQVEAYLIAVKKRRKHAATHRYISVETLRPTRKQLEDFTRKQEPAHPVEPAQLHCLMLYDTQSREFVGSGCYVISTEPLAGVVTKFESVSAEFVGHETL